MRVGKFRLLIVSAVIFALIFSLGGVAAAPGGNQGNGPPDISKVVFVHYPQGKGWGPGGNPDKGGGGENGGGKLWYKYSGIHWANPSVTYRINPNLNGAAAPDAFLSGIKASFQTWDNASGPYAASYSGATGSVPDNLVWDEASDQFVPDGVNVVGWKDISADYPHAIAVTYMWFYTLSKELIDVDTALNSNEAFFWHQITISEEPNEAQWPTGLDTGAYDVDVQNIMTHEAGHWLVLNDLYNKPAKKQTMYGISAELELQKRSLESGDEAGIQEIYPGT